MAKIGGNGKQFFGTFGGCYRLGVAPPTFNRSTIICDIQPDRAAVI
jgi:hypothetical protein